MTMIRPNLDVVYGICPRLPSVSWVGKSSWPFQGINYMYDLIEMKFTVLDSFLPKLPLKLNFTFFNNLFYYIDEFIFVVQYERVLS